MELSTPTYTVLQKLCQLSWTVWGSQCSQRTENMFPTEAKDNAVVTMTLTGLDQPETVLMADKALGFCTSHWSTRLPRIPKKKLAKNQISVYFSCFIYLEIRKKHFVHESLTNQVDSTRF
jgi:hypothetical protein